MSSTAPLTSLRSAPTSFRLVLPTGIPGLTTAGKLTLSPTAVGNGTSPGGGPLISGVGGTGFILIFVACGVLLVLAIVTIILRTLRPGRPSLQSGGAPWDDLEGHTRPSTPDVGEKPQLCEMRVDPSSAPRGSAVWRNIQPLSVSRIAEPITLPALKRTKRGSVSSIDSIYSQESDTMTSIPLSPPPRYAMDLGSRPPVISPSLHPTSPKPASVRVAMPIAMPRPPPSARNPWNVTSPHDVDFDAVQGSYFERAYRGSREDGNIAEFCLGVAEVQQQLHTKRM